MRNVRVLITLLCASVHTVGCASSPSASGASGASGGNSSSMSRYVVTEDELARVGDRSAYEALQQLRPTFLRSRDPVTQSHPEATPVAVFVNGGRTEGLDAL